MNSCCEWLTGTSRVRSVPNKLANAPELMQTIQSLAATMANLQDMMKRVDGGLSPAMRKLPEIVDVNVKGTLYTLRAALPHLLRSEAADVVTIASEAGRRGLPFEAVYCASKFAQVGLTRALDHELRPQGVRCTNVCPGGVATEFAMGRGRTPDMPELTNMMSPQDVADAVLFVLTRPRNLRILEVAFRPMSEPSWG